MTPGFAKIVRCPFCGAKKELMTLNSGNSIGSQWWSDTKIISPMLPHISPVQKCPKCGKYYLEYKQDIKNTNEYSEEDGKLSYWEWKEAYNQFCTIDNDKNNRRKILFRKNGKTALDKEDWANVRGWLVQSYNDCFYRCPVEKEPPLEEYDFIVGVIKQLIETINWGEASIPLFFSGVRCSLHVEEEETWTSAMNPLWKAELFREANEFEKSAEILQSIDYNCLDEFQKRLYDKIQEKITNRDVEVFIIFDESKKCMNCGWMNDNDTSRCQNCDAPLDLTSQAKCPNGHIYTGGTPYPCFHPNTQASPKRTKCFIRTKKRKTFITKVCPQGHSYDEKEPNCPFCGDKVVVSTIELEMPHSIGIHNFFYEKEGTPIRNLKVSVDGASIGGEVHFIVYERSFYKYKYCVADRLGNELTIFPKSTITISGEGFSDTFSGHEFYRMCDSLCGYLRNVCPHGHFYRVFEPCCPFCGESEVASIDMDFQGHTIWYSDFYYEKEGLPLHELKVFVDGNTISGKIVLRIYHVGGSNTKYKYCVVNSLGLELTVFPKSTITFSGESFSDSFSGREFYKMCDELFERRKETKDSNA